MGDSGEALLKKVYYEKCPGCKIEQRKEAHLGLPFKELFYVWLVTLGTALPISSLFPFLYFMIRDFHIAKRVEDIGYYAGYVGSAFMFGRALTSIIWGMIADRYGRKPVIVIGTLSVVIFNTLFGLSMNFWMAISMRFLLGSLNGLLGPIKVSTAWGIGLIIGPAVGGFLAQETLHMHHEDKGSKSNEDVESVYYLDSKTNGGETREKEPKESLLKNWPLMSSVIVYCVFSMHDMAYTEIFSLWAVSEKKFGGLSFTSQDVGVVLAVSGFGLLLFQATLYPIIERNIGPIKISRYGASQDQRGAANGISMAGMSLFKAVAPAAGGAVFALAQKRQHASFLPEPPGPADYLQTDCKLAHMENFALQGF
ncbi:Protein ZINC INDUCED FACILITATOR-LIKE 1 [Acorus calamus]|uniref:Protein ZINC INDUCED FACILITATOR-LIKE 1 n=1 Tax=Acorus calamus TaxID=4465 RepID=A0AAV9F1M0_ACOCL|nr:Protein ZINC INDUCED FACILITATOR-LIKE 1 [Acorus calamus]